MPYGFGRQLPIIPPRLIDLNLPPNHINILATMALVNSAEGSNDKNTPRTHRSFQNHQRYRRPQRKSAQLTDGRRLTRRRMVTHSTSMIKPGEFIFRHQLLPHRHHREG